MNKNINKKIYLLKHNNNVLVDVSIPIKRNILSPKDDDWMIDCLCNQYKNGLQEALNQYDNSPLPKKYIDGQDFIVTILPREIIGHFIYFNDEIYVDADAISNIRRTNAANLIGHEIGHKISKYLNTKNIKSIYDEISRIFYISSSNKEKLNETFADLVGFIVDDNGTFSYPIDKDNGKKQYAKRKVLESIYRI